MRDFYNCPLIHTRNRNAATEEMRTENTKKQLFCSLFSVFSVAFISKFRVFVNCLEATSWDLIQLHL